MQTASTQTAAHLQSFIHPFPFPRPFPIYPQHGWTYTPSTKQAGPSSNSRETPSGVRLRYGFRPTEIVIRRLHPLYISRLEKMSLAESNVSMADEFLRALDPSVLAKKTGRRAPNARTFGSSTIVRAQRRMISHACSVPVRLSKRLGGCLYGRGTRTLRSILRRAGRSSRFWKSFDPVRTVRRVGVVRGSVFMSFTVSF